MDSLHLDDKFEDTRGKTFSFSYGDKKINIVEIKKGFARGGHYYKFEQVRLIITGKIEYREENLTTGKEQVRIVHSPDLVKIPPNTPHLFIALENTVFIEFSEQKFESINYPKYREIVKDMMKLNNTV